MDFAFSEDQVALQALAHEILTEQCTHEHLKSLEAASSNGSVYDAQLWKQLAASGLTGIGVPEEHGGAGLGFLDLSVIFDEVGRAVAPVPAVATLVTAYVLAKSAPDAVASILPGVASGDTVLTTGFGDVQDLTARKDGNRWLLDGEKGFVPYGAEADVVVVPATVDGRTLLALLPKGTARVSITELHTTNHEPQALLTFSGVALDASQVIEDGGEVYADLVRHHTAALSMVAAGVVKAALEMTAKYTSEREQFDKKIASFQAVGQRAADAYIDAEMIRLTALQAVWRLSEGWPADEEIAIAKFWAGDGGMRVVHATQHLHGGIGVDIDYPVHRYFIWCKQIEHELGTPTRQLLSLGAMLADTPA
ncbi:MAG TPA: acyl-CoA dehydrogenase family protein [Mycobacteriales bacterium]|nr:acyl-CoA dehydrogenase family protein [Mycobacteriales bacterium]